MLAVIQEAYVKGVSTRKVDDIVKALGMTGISKSSVSRICQELDEMVDVFMTRPLMKKYPYVWLDATYQMRLAVALLAEQHDEWATCRRYLSLESMAKLYGQQEPDMPAELLVAVGYRLRENHVAFIPLDGTLPVKK